MNHNRYTLPLCVVAAFMLAPAIALACNPAPPHGEIELTFGLSGTTGHPINAPLLVHWKDTWTRPSAELSARESFPISMSVFPTGQQPDPARPAQYDAVWGQSGEIQFTLEDNLLPNTDYTMVAHVASDWPEHEPQTWTFRTGEEVLDYPVSVDFAGISTLRIMEVAAPRHKCCPTNDYGACADCYVVGMDYPKVVEMSFEAVASAHPVRYAIYEHDSIDPQSKRELLQHVYPKSSTVEVSMQFSASQDGVCVSVVAQPYNAVGAEEGEPTQIVCTAQEDLQTIERLPEDYDTSPCRGDEPSPTTPTDSEDKEEEPPIYRPPSEDSPACSASPSRPMPVGSGVALCGLLLGLCAWRRRKI